MRDITDLLAFALVGRKLSLESDYPMDTIGVED
jgi:hypothetical protein